MKFTAVSPFGREFEGDVESVVIDTNEGRHVLLPEHADFIGFFGLSTAIVAVAPDTSAQDAVLWAAFGYIHVFSGEVLLIAQMIDEDEDHVRSFHDGVVSQRLAQQGSANG